MRPTLETARLRLRSFTTDDAPFVFRVMNSPGWLRFIGDRGIRTIDDAKRYLEEGPITSYARNGFGLLHVSRREDDAPVGMCGLLRRDWLPDVEIGFAFLPEFCGIGYATEAVAATLLDAERSLGLRRVTAIVQPDNAASLRVLAKAGFAFERVVTAPNDTAELHLLAKNLGSGA